MNLPAYGHGICNKSRENMEALGKFCGCILRYCTRKLGHGRFTCSSLKLMEGKIKLS